MRSEQRVLLIEDDPDYTQLMSALVSNPEHGFAFALQSVATLEAALVSIGYTPPALILLDLNLLDSTGYDTFLKVREVARGVPIVVLTGLDDEGLALRAVEDGAQDYLIKSQVQPKHIARCMNMALRRHDHHGTRAEKSNRPGAVIACIGSKGGVGTSTVAVNVAALFAQNRFNPVLIELQLGNAATSSLYLESEPAKGLNGLFRKAPDLLLEADFTDCLAHSAYGLPILCPTDSAGSGRALGADYAHAIISLARRSFPVVILDLPPRLDEGVAEALKLSDSIALIVDRETSAMHCGRTMLQKIRVFAAPKREVDLVVVERVGFQIPISIADIKDEIKLKPRAIVPFSANAIALSHAARMPLALFCPNEPFSHSLIELADSMIPASARTQLSKRPDLRSLERPANWQAIPETLYS